jgi:5-deoxy-glucuronate isomerase
MKNETNTALDKMIFRNTHGHIGRQVAVSPDNSSTRHLCYGRIILNRSQPTESFSTGARETGLVCLSGEALLKIDSKEVAVGQYDAIYIPRDSNVQITTKSTVDLAEFSAEVAGKYPVQVVRYSDVEKDPGLNFTTGEPGARRHLNMLLAKNVQAGRLVAGFTDSEPGNWTSWPPHEHAEMLEEIYVFFNMPEPAFGIQMVYNNTDYPELITVVRDGDAVLMPSGFHRKVSVPGHRISFLWAMAAHREVEDRQFGVVNVQRGFEQGGSGLEAGRKQ